MQSFSARGWTGRILRAVPVLVQLGLVGTIGMTATGCGALAALTNPKAGWAFSEPAPMSVVVRRAEVASETAKQVDRLMGRTPVDETSKWIPKTALKKADAEALLADVGTDETYAAAKGQKLRVVPAEAWVATFSTICSDESKYPSLLGATSPALATAYDDISGQQKALAALKTQVDAEEKALDEKNITADAKTEHQKKKDDLEAQIKKQEESYKPKVEAFLKQVKEEAGKADDATKQRLGVALVNLRRAVDDAKTDNSVALIRYPMAIPSMTTDLQSSAKRIIADVIEEKTGKRPDMSSLKPEVTLDGLTPKITLNGLSPSDIGGLDPEEVLSETTLRLTGYAGRMLSLVAYADATQDQLSFEADVLDAWIGGFKLDAAKVQGAGDDLGDLKIETGAPAKAKEAASDPSKDTKARHSAGGLRMANTCAVGEKPAPVAEAKESKKPEKVAEKRTPKAKSGASSRPTTTASTTSATSSSMMSGGPTSNASHVTEKAADKKPDGQGCDLVVTNGQGSTCL